MIEIRSGIGWGSWHIVGCPRLRTETNDCHCPKDVQLRPDATVLTADQRTSRHLKRSLMDHLYWKLHFQYAIDEMNFIDVLGVRNNGYTVEYEVKVSKADFDRELRIIHAESVDRYGKDWEKYIKHKYYLKREIVEERYANGKNRMIPNDFYFYVPDYLADYAASSLEGLPYGVVKIGKVIHGLDRVSTWRYTVVKKAVKLHKEKASESTISAIAHGLMARNIDLLRKVEEYEANARRDV